MKAIRNIVQTVLAVAAIFASQEVKAQASTAAGSNGPVVVVTHDSAGLGGVPKGIKNMIFSFEVTRDKFLAAQNLLRIQLNHATTAAEREQIRLQLQANREAFLAALKSFRAQLKDQLAALKGKISHEEFLRIIDAAHNAETEGGLNHHKGH